jgi:homoserine O-acetyltransferase
MKRTKTYRAAAPFHLESGEVLPELNIAYHTFGDYVPGKSKVIWVCHALTANSDVSDWWEGLFGKQQYFDRAEYFVICANCIASCYGTTGPLSYTPDAKRYFLDFPLVTTRDMARAHSLLLEQLGIESLYLLIGSSLGGQQAQELAVLLGEKLQNLVLIATNAYHSPYGIACNESQRLALLADPSFTACDYNGGKNGLRAARSIAMLSYRSYAGYLETQYESGNQVVDGFRAASYQRYQGLKLANRFNAYSYWSLTKSMDAHNIGRNKFSAEAALQTILANTLVVGISSDILFPVSEQEFLQKHIPRAMLTVIDSIFGHDGFLVETAQLEKLIADFLYNDFKTFRQTAFKTNKHLKSA